MELRPIHEFDEAWYLETNEDAASAVRQDEICSGYMHFRISGRADRRRAAPTALSQNWSKNHLRLAFYGAHVRRLSAPDGL